MSDDLEMTRKCAEKMGLLYRVVSGNTPEHTIRFRDGPYQDSLYQQYWPIGNDAQAMALVERLKLEIRYNRLSEKWICSVSYESDPWTYNENLNRAIVECVARMP